MKLVAGFQEGFLRGMVLMCFVPVISKADNFVLNQVHRADYRLEVPDHHLNASIGEGADLGIWRRPL